MENNTKEHIKRVDGVLKDVVYRSLDKGLNFNFLDNLIDEICARLKDSKNVDGQMALIHWISHLHFITNVNILDCVPEFLVKLFQVV